MLPQMECLDEIIADCFGIAKTDLSGVETQHTERMDADENDADEGQALWNSEELAKTDLSVVEIQHNAVMDDKENVANENDADENNADKNNADENNADENNADEGWWLNESQLLLSSQQLVEGLSICDDLLLSQSPLRDGEHKDKPRLSISPSPPTTWKEAHNPMGTRILLCSISAVTIVI
ncbi:hypothetical protein RIF29_13301 [Crotalaria pallida]|uniref:Uncharacterized protein n=1 Tax=Crotalaria pallida TaxID=3830 RepID=A0AAN9IPE5_CROPI